jgi:hypothetical protein
LQYREKVLDGQTAAVTFEVYLIPGSVFLCVPMALPVRFLALPGSTLAKPVAPCKSQENHRRRWLQVKRSTETTSVLTFPILPILPILGNAQD